MKVKIPIELEVSGDMPVRKYITAVAGEKKSRVLQVTFVYHGALVEIPQNAQVTLKCMRADGVYVKSFGSVLASGGCELELPSQISANPGNAVCEVEAASPEDGAVLISSAFEVRTLPSVIPNNAEEQPEVSDTNNVISPCGYIGTFAVTPYLEGISAALAVSLEYPLLYDSWNLFVDGAQISGDIARGDSFVTAPVIFKNDDICVSFVKNESELFTVRLVKVIEAAGAVMGTLILEEDKNE